MIHADFKQKLSEAIVNEEIQACITELLLKINEEEPTEHDLFFGKPRVVL